MVFRLAAKVKLDPIVVVELDVSIFYNESNVTTMYVDEGSDLPESIMCRVSPDTTGYNDALDKSRWDVYTITDKFDKHNLTELKRPTRAVREELSVDEEGWYACQYTIPDINQTNSASVQILVNGLCARSSIHLSISGRSLFAVDCGWSKWGDCFVK